MSDVHVRCRLILYVFNIFHRVLFFNFLCWAQTWQPRWNERRLRELAQEEGTDRYRNRTGRMDKWRQVAREAAPEDHQGMEAPENIRSLGEVWQCFSTVFPRCAGLLSTCSILFWTGLTKKCSWGLGCSWRLNSFSISTSQKIFPKFLSMFRFPF